MFIHHIGQPAKHSGFLNVEKRRRQFMQSGGKATVIHSYSKIIKVAPKQNGNHHREMM